MSLKSNFTTAKMEANANKNRYTDVLALEGTRVHLPYSPYCSTDYINANFVNTEMCNFICTQSPLVKTSFDFWLMVWEQKSTVILALNRLVENRTIKGDRYWPDKEKRLQFENLTVNLLGTLTLPDIHVTIRKLKLCYFNTEREIYHLHYEGWPDFGVPQNTLEIRELVRIAFFYQKLSNSNAKQPMVVHCSAGIGRSGSFMVIASIMSDPTFNRLYEEGYSKSDIGTLYGIISQFRIPDMVLSFRQKKTSWYSANATTV
jgi:protein tyrosine phosphatase